MRVKFSGHNLSSFWFCPGDSFKLQMQGEREKKQGKGIILRIGEQVETLSSRDRVACPKLKDAELRAEGEKGSGNTHPVHPNPNTRALLAPFCSPRLCGHQKAWLWPLTLQRRQEGPVCPGRGGRPKGAGSRPLLHLPLSPQYPRELTKPPGTGCAGGRN